jgi:hypothetical protein
MKRHVAGGVITTAPTVYLISRDGMLLGKAIGPRPPAQPSGRALIAGLGPWGLTDLAVLYVAATMHFLPGSIF